MEQAQPTRELRGGGRMPVLGLGVFRMADGHETEQAIEWAFEAGYRHIDTASVYRNERSVGAAVRRSGLRREDVFVTTKLMPLQPSAAGALDKSLKRLGLDYVDLYLIHWPLPLASARIWRQLELLQERGLARAIGVSNFGRDRLARLIGSTASVPAVNQVQFSPYHYRRRLLEYCDAQGIVFEAFNPLARGVGPSDPKIVAVAVRLDRTPAQVMLRWAIQHGAVVIPKSSQKDRIRSNAQLFDFELGEADMKALDTLDRTNGSAEARGEKRASERNG